MILRRVIAHFRKQEWTAIFLDFLIVVMGVFIGIQVSNWNAAQADARLGSDYVRRLTRELSENLAGIRAEIAYYAAVLKSVQYTEALLNETDPDPRALVINAYRASEISYSAPVRATWDQIVSSAHLGLLPPEALDSGLSQYYAFNTVRDAYDIGLASNYRRTIRKIIPIGMQMEMRARCSDVRDRWGNIVGFVQSCEFDASPAALKVVADALRSDPAVAADLRFHFSSVTSISLNLEGVQTTLEQALVALGAEPDSLAKEPQ